MINLNRITGERMEQIKSFFQQRDKLGQYLGIEILEAGPGYAKTSMELRSHHLNGIDVAHGGTIFTLADIAFAVACNSHGTVAVAINVSISFVKAATTGMLYAEARETSKNPKLSTVHVDVTDAAGDLVATFQGMAYRKKDNLLEIE